MKSSLAIVALLATTIGLGTVLPALAQSTPTPPAAPSATVPDGHNGMHGLRKGGMGQRHMTAPGKGMGRGMGPTGLLMLACSDKGAEALEVGLVRMAHRLDLTADQQKLFDTFRTKALTTETSFADTCKASRPDTAADVKPDALTRLKTGIAVDQARLTAMTDVLPDFEALFNSLSDQQKANLLPNRGMGMGGGKGHGQNGMGQDGMGMGHDGAGRGMDHNGPSPSHT